MHLLTELQEKLLKLKLKYIGRHGLNKSEQLKDVDFMLNSLISFLAFMV